MLVYWILGLYFLQGFQEIIKVFVSMRRYDWNDSGRGGVARLDDRHIERRVVRHIASVVDILVNLIAQRLVEVIEGHVDHLGLMESSVVVWSVGPESSQCRGVRVDSVDEGSVSERTGLERIEVGVVVELVTGEVVDVGESLVLSPVHGVLWLGDLLHSVDIPLLLAILVNQHQVCSLGDLRIHCLRHLTPFHHRRSLHLVVQGLLVQVTHILGHLVMGLIAL
jgi:hypothetical protein